MDFNREFLESFLGAVRKYMQVRGPMSQKELSTLCEVGVSTISRFLSQKTTEINAQLVAKIVAKLNIPMHEIIDFIAEESTEKFMRLVKFYKEEAKDSGAPQTAAAAARDESAPESTNITGTKEYGRRADDSMESAISDTLSTGTAARNAQAKINVGGKKSTVSFSSDEDSRHSEKNIREKLDALTPRQKAYMSDFLSLDMEGRDLIVDIGNNLFRYFRQRDFDL